MKSNNKKQAFKESLRQRTMNGVLTATVVEAKDLDAKGLAGLLQQDTHFFAYLTVAGQRLRTPSQSQTVGQDPKWNQTFRFEQVPVGTSCVSVQVYNEQSWGADQPIGENTSISITSCLQNGHSVGWFDLFSFKKGGHKKGSIHLSFKFEDAGGAGGAGGGGVGYAAPAPGNLPYGGAPQPPVHVPVAPVLYPNPAPCLQPNPVACALMGDPYHRAAFTHPCGYGPACPDWRTQHRTMFTHIPAGQIDDEPSAPPRPAPGPPPVVPQGSMPPVSTGRRTDQPDLPPPAVMPAVVAPAKPAPAPVPKPLPNLKPGAASLKPVPKSKPRPKPVPAPAPTPAVGGGGAGADLTYMPLDNNANNKVPPQSKALPSLPACDGRPDGNPSRCQQMQNTKHRAQYSHPCRYALKCTKMQDATHCKEFNHFGVSNPVADDLCKAAWNNDVESMKKIFPSKLASIDAKNDRGQTALYCAARNGHFQASKWLLDRNADPTQTDAHGSNPVYTTAWAKLNDYKKVLEILLVAYGKVHDCDQNCNHAKLVQKRPKKQPAAGMQAAPSGPGSFLEIKYSDLKRASKIGGGSFKTVFLGEYKGQPVAIGELIGDLAPGEELQEFEHELSILARMSHPNVVKLIGAAINPPTRALVTEFMEFGSLGNVIYENSSGSNAWKQQKVRICFDLAKGLEYMHGLDIAHRDLKSMNVLVSKTLQVKLTDFGLSKPFQANVQATFTQKGSIVWMAPEIFVANADSPYDPFMADVYAMAMVFFEVWGELQPFFNAKDVGEIVTRLVVLSEMFAIDRLPEESPYNAPQALKTLQRSMAEHDPTTRPTMKAVVQALAAI